MVKILIMCWKRKKLYLILTGVNFFFFVWNSIWKQQKVNVKKTGFKLYLKYFTLIFLKSWKVTFYNFIQLGNVSFVIHGHHKIAKVTSTCAQSLSHVPLFATPWMYPSMFLYPWGFSRQEYWKGLPCPPPGDLPDPGIKPMSLALQADSLLSEPPGKPKNTRVGSLSLFQGIFPIQESNCIAGRSFTSWATREALSAHFNFRTSCHFCFSAFTHLHFSHSSMQRGRQKFPGEQPLELPLLHPFTHLSLTHATNISYGKPTLYQAHCWGLRK